MTDSPKDCTLAKDLTDEAIETAEEIQRHWMEPKGFIGRLFARRMAKAKVGRLLVSMPKGRGLMHEGSLKGPEARIHLRSFGALRRLMLGGHNGFAEAYIKGDIDIPDLTALFHWFLANEEAIDADTRGTKFSRIKDRLTHLLRSNTKAGSRRNIIKHYDLGNDFYAPWLDSSMTYSSAYFSSPDYTETLEQAQAAKYDEVLKALDFKQGQNILEIGCGWGGFADRALEKGAGSLTGLTLSHEQHKYSIDRLEPYGDKATIKLQDYRDETGCYDAIASIEMIEAVGEAYWPVYFRTLEKCLKKGGRAALQVITIEEKRFEIYRQEADFIQRYVFPGGMLMTKEIFFREARKAGLTALEPICFGPHYSETLRRWQRSFLKHWPQLQKQGFDDRFYRMWRYYLSYCEAGFDAGSIDVGIYSLVKA